jgi:nitrate reductase (NAD(P)H)
MSTTDETGFPPTPPYSEKSDSDVSSLLSDGESGSIPLPPPTTVPIEVLPPDLNSPDKHVPRDPRLIRLTGNHPFNCEAPLTALFEAGEIHGRNIAN